MDSITQKRILKFIEDFRKKEGHPPSIQDFESNRFDRKQVDQAVRSKLIEQFYVTLTNGTIIKVYKCKLSL